MQGDGLAGAAGLASESGAQELRDELQDQAQEVAVKTRDGSAAPQDEAIPLSVPPSAADESAPVSPIQEVGEAPGDGLKAAEQATESDAPREERPQQEEPRSIPESSDAPSVATETSAPSDEPAKEKDEDQQEVVAFEEPHHVQESSQEPSVPDQSAATVDGSGEESKDEQEIAPIEQLSIHESSVTPDSAPEETPAAEVPSTDTENQPEVAADVKAVVTQDSTQPPSIATQADEPDKEATVQQEAVPVTEKSVEESSPAPSVALQNGSTVSATGTEKEDPQEVAPAEKVGIQEKELPSVGVVNASAAGEPAKEGDDQKEGTSLEELLVKEGSQPSSEVPQNSVAEKEAVAPKGDEQRILQEMRAKVAELDPLSKDTDEATLRRFLRARSWKVPKAAKMFVDHQKWRRSFVPLGHIPQEQVKNELEAEKVFLQGHDKKGRPIALILAAKHDANKRKFDEFKHYLVFNFDTLVASLKPGEETFTVILDLKGLAYKNLDARGWISTFDFLQAYYPERLGRLFIVHVPKIFWGAWKLVSPFVDKVTRDKIVFVEEKLLEEKLSEEIDKNQIPTVYCGTLPLVPIQNAVIPNWPPTQADAPQTT